MQSVGKSLKKSPFLHYLPATLRHLNFPAFCFWVSFGESHLLNGSSYPSWSIQQLTFHQNSPTFGHFWLAKCDFCHVLLLLGPPSAPGEPKIVDFDNKSVTLRWTKPKDTGGRPISHYIIQKKDKFGGWFDALITDDDNCTATIEELEARVPGLSEGKWYQFRVIAVNKAGESDPSPHTRPHLCRHKNRKPIRTFLACPFFPAAAEFFDI